MSDERILTVDEVARMLRVDDETVRRMLRDGRLAGVRLGGRRLGWRVYESAVWDMLRGATAARSRPRPATGAVRRTAALARLRDQAERARERGDVEGAERFETIMAGMAEGDTLD